MPKPPKVAVMLGLANVANRMILAGVRRFLGADSPWDVSLEVAYSGPEWLSSSQWGGVLFLPSYPEMKSIIRRMSVPVVIVRGSSGEFNLPWVDSDDAGIGLIGATHLMERGFRHFAFCGSPDFAWSSRRLKAFQDTLEKKGFSASNFSLPIANSLWNQHVAQIAHWLKALPKPVAVMACNDNRAILVIEACRRAALKIPDDVSVLGADNEYTCELTNPPLSSVKPNLERIGYEAAKILDTLMKGESPALQQITVNPVGVVTRQSTDTSAGKDWLITEAIRFIKQHALRGCKVTDVQKHLNIGRTTLKQHFQRSLNRSPQEEIHRVQIAEIKELLRETDFTLTHIAEAAGFEHPEYLSVFFKRETGLTPGEYRKHVLEFDDA